MTVAAIKEQQSNLLYVDIPNPKIFANMEVKQAVIRAILLSLKSGNSVEGLIDYLTKHRVKWPELEKIRSVIKRQSIS